MKRNFANSPTDGVRRTKNDGGNFLYGHKVNKNFSQS